MQDVLTYLRSFFRTLDKRLLISCVLFTALLIFLNFQFRIERGMLAGVENRFLKLAAYFLMYLIAFGIPYLFAFLFTRLPALRSPMLWLLVAGAAMIFALKVNFSNVAEWVLQTVPGEKGRFYAVIVNLPSRLLLVILCLWIVWWRGKYPPPLFGLTVRGVKWKPYLIMLLLMIPLVAWASTRPDFLHTYPKLKMIYFLGDTRTSLHNLLFELAYGLDFVSIEFFFRGFLVLGFLRYAGTQAILPMAVFYCSIHFGKPLMECISSFFGGIILGVVVYRTRSIAGGLLVHLGIAWMMELGGYLGGLH